MNELENFGIDLAAPQKIIFDVMSNLNYATFRLPRGGGKGLLLAMYALRRAIDVAGSSISIIAPSYRQSKLVYQELDRIVATGRLPDCVSVVSSFNTIDKCILMFKNGSCVRAVASSEDLFDSAVVLVDESSHMPNSVLVQMTTGIESYNFEKIFMMSSGYYDDNYMLEIESHPSFSVCAFGYKSFPKGFYDQANIDEARRILSKEIFSMEYDAKICVWEN